MRVLILLTIFVSTLTFGQEKAFFDQVKGKTITGQAVDKRQATFVFSADGKTVTLKKNAGYKHTFLTMIDDIAIYQGKRGGKTHYDAFMIQDTGIAVTSGDEVGGERKSNNPKKIAQALMDRPLMFSFK